MKLSICESANLRSYSMKGELLIKKQEARGVAKEAAHKSLTLCRT